MQLTADTSRPAGAQPPARTAPLSGISVGVVASHAAIVLLVWVLLWAVRSFAAVSSLSSLQMMIACPDVTASTTCSYLLPFFHFAQLVPLPRSAGSNFSPPNLSMNFCMSATSLKQ